MSKPKRLHPAAVLENLIKNISSFIQFLIGSSVAIFASPLSKAWIIGILLGGLGLYIVFAIISWLRFSYFIYNDELRIEQGVFARHKTYIPIERIQSVQISAGIVQRVFGLVKLEVQTAGGNRQAEASLSAITKDQALELQEKLHIDTNNENLLETAMSTPNLEKKLELKDLFITATTSNGIGVVLVGGLAFLSQINQYIPEEDIYTRLGKYFASYASDGILVYIIGVIFILLLAWLLSILGTIITTGGFRITRYEDRLLIERGLIEKRQISIPLRRIQAVKIVEGILRHPFGLATIHVVSAGHGDKSSTDTLIFPLISAQEVADFLETFLPEFELERHYNPLSKRAKNRYRMILTIPALLLVLPLIIFFKYGFLALLLPLLAYLWGIKQYRDAGWQITGQQLAVRFRIFGLNTFLVKRFRIQSFELQQNPLQKRKNLKSFVIKIASSVGGTKISLKGIDEEEGNKIMAWFDKNN